MSKSFGKIVLASTILAGAAVGAYSYLKKEGYISGVQTDDENSSASDAASDFVAKERNYVDLSSTTLEKVTSTVKEAATEVKDVVANAVNDVAKEVKNAVADANASKEADVVADVEFEEGLQAESVEADDHIVGSESSEEFFNDESEE